MVQSYCLRFLCTLIILSASGVFAQKKNTDLDKATNLLNQKKYEDALIKVREILNSDSAHQTTQTPEHCKTYEIKAKAHEGLFQAMEASIAYQNALIAARQQVTHVNGIEQISQVLLQLGQFYYRYHYYPQAKEYVRLAFASIDTLKERNHILLANLLKEGGIILWKSGSLAESENWLSRANKIYKDSIAAPKETISQTTILLACIKTCRGEYEVAESILNEHLPLLLKNSSLNDAAYREGLFHKAKLFAETGRFQQAFLILNDLMTFLKTEEPNLVEASRLAADLYCRLGDFKSALDLAEKTRFRYEEVMVELPDLYVYSYASLLNVYYASGDSASAEKYYEQASLLTRKSLGKEHAVYAWILGEKGLFLLKIGRFKDAMLHLNKSAQIWEDKTGWQSVEYGKALYRLGYANAFIGKYNKAQPYFLKALDIFRVQLSTLHPVYCQTMDETAELFTLVARYEEAEKYLKPIVGYQQERLKQAESTQFEIPYALIRLARVYSLQGRYSSCDSLLSLAQVLCKNFKGYDRYYEGLVFKEKSRSSQLRGDYGLALNEINTASEIFLSMPFRGRLPDVYQKRNQVAYAECLTRKGLCLTSQGKYYAASENLLKALDLFKAYQGEDYVPFAEALSGLARINFQLGYYTQAEKQSQRAKEIMAYVAGDFHPAYSESLRLHAEILLALGRIEEAGGYIEQAVKISKDRLGIQHPSYARHLSDWAYIQFIQGKRKEAVESLRDALNILKSNKDANPAVISKTEMRLALLLKDEKAYIPAQVLLIQSSSRLEKEAESFKPLLCEVRYLNGMIHLEQQNWAEAENWLNRALVIQTELLHPQHPDILINQMQLALAIWKQGRIQESKVLFSESIAQYLNLSKKYFSGMSEIERARYYTKLQPYLQVFGNFVSENSLSQAELTEQLLNFQLEAKGLLLHESALIKAHIARSGNPELLNTFEEWSDQSGQLARMQISQDNGIAASRNELLKLQESIANLEKDLSKKSTLAYSLLNEEKPNWKSIQKSLLPGEAAIEILRTRKDAFRKDSGDYVAIVLRPDISAPVLIPLGDAYKAETASLINYRRSILNKIEDPYSFESYWAPLLSSLNQVSKVYICPDGVYHFINPETFQTPEKKSLGETLQILRVGNLREIHNLDPAINRISQSSTQKNALLVGNPDFYLDRNTLTRTNPLESLPLLPGTEAEVKNIETLLTSKNWKCTTLLGMYATEQNVRNCKSPALLHLATHGYFISDTEHADLSGIKGSWLAKNPMLRSGLLLTGSASALAGYYTSPDEAEDGILTAYEVVSMDLSSTDLVVLSACETGLGEVQSGEGLLGLQRGFRIAGAKSIIMTLWDISDAVTSEVMLYFYQNFLEGQSHAEALKNAIQEIRKKYPEPYYWGGFILNGT
jgi:tetratricopeptide (TPR) repeat protein